MKRLLRAGMVLFAAAMLCAGAPCTAYAEKKSDYDYDMDYFGDMWWDGFTANFDKLDDAKKYDVNIARNDHHLATETTTKHSVNFKKYFTRDGDYTFRVRGIRGQNVGDWGEWSEIQGYYDGQLDKPSDDSHHSGGKAPELLEHEASRWLSQAELRSVDWLPADLQVVEALESR